MNRTPLMISKMTFLLICAVAGLSFAQAPSVEYGSGLDLAPVKTKLLPTMKIAKAVGWKDGRTPVPGAELRVSAIAQNLRHPRWLYVLPNGDVLVAESEAPPKPDDAKGLVGKIRKAVMKKAGSGAQASADRITLLRPGPNDNDRWEKFAFLEHLHSPIGMALVGNTLYIANSDSLVRVPYRPGTTAIEEAPVEVTKLPAGTINHHWTKSLIASPDGKTLYVGVGSNSNVAENGIPAEQERAAVWQIDPGSGQHQLYATGLRNPVGLAWEPDSQVLWVAVNERDELGDDVPPDYMTGLRAGAFYGWPYSYYGDHVDKRVRLQRPDLVKTAVVPDYALGAHTASLGLCWSGLNQLPARYQQGMFIGQHGSWNRRAPSGYKVVFVAFAQGKPTAMPLDVLSGFLNDKGQAQGRPVGVAIDRAGGLLVADDVGNTIWRVSSATRGRQ